jgi:hypothetical protein
MNLRNQVNVLEFLQIDFKGTGKKLEDIDRAVGFIFSRTGFTKDAEDYCKKKWTACGEDERRLESGKLKQPLV